MRSSPLKRLTFVSVVEYLVPIIIAFSNSRSGVGSVAAIRFMVPRITLTGFIQKDIGYNKSDKVFPR